MSLAWSGSVRLCYSGKADQASRIPCLYVMHCAGGYNRERAIESVQSKHADLICLGRHYLSNPDLPRRFREHAELNKYNRDTFYSQGDEGYIDYPFLEEGTKH